MVQSMYVMGISHAILLPNEVRTPLGRWVLAGEIRGGRGVVPARPLRVYGSYAVMCVLRGDGEYVDANGLRHRLRPGSVVTVFPELAHSYGPPRGRHWDEIYLTFDGPSFDLWRETGLLSPTRPVARPPRSGEWPERLRALIGEIAATRPQALLPTRVAQMQRFLGLLGELLPDAAAGEPESRPDWLARACALLETDLGLSVDLADAAAEAGMRYETFRKRFQRAMGVSPARYRMQKRLQAAQELLRYSPQMTNRQVADALGFSDEFHFSRRFARTVGQTPSAFRAAPGRRGAGQESGGGDPKVTA